MKQILTRNGRLQPFKIPSFASLNQGDQIAYLPSHAGKSLDAAGVEFGFVTSTHTQRDGQKIVYCRFWLPDKPGELRTKANSEPTPIESIVLCRTVDQDVVVEALRLYCAN